MRLSFDVRHLKVSELTYKLSLLDEMKFRYYDEEDKSLCLKLGNRVDYKVKQ